MSSCMELVCIPGTDDTTVKLITFLFWHAAPLLAPGSQYLSLVQLHYITFHFRELFTKQPQAIDIYYWYKSIMINPVPNGELNCCTCNIQLWTLCTGSSTHCPAIMHWYSSDIYFLLGTKAVLKPLTFWWWFYVRSPWLKSCKKSPCFYEDSHDSVRSQICTLQLSCCDMCKFVN